MERRQNNNTLRTPELKAFIQKHSALFWYTPKDKKEFVSDEFLIETILNHGTLDDFKELDASTIFDSLIKSEFYGVPDCKYCKSGTTGRRGISNLLQFSIDSSLKFV